MGALTYALHRLYRGDPQLIIQDYQSRMNLLNAYPLSQSNRALLATVYKHPDSEIGPTLDLPESLS
jgi:hypothetical protein